MPVKAYPTMHGDYGTSGDLISISPAHHSIGFAQNVPPSRLQMNAELNEIWDSIQYLLQGLSEFAVGQSYGVGRYIVDSNKIYKSLLSQTALAGDLANPAKWDLAIDLSNVLITGAYNATTNAPAVASVTNGSELFVETAGTQTIGGVAFDLNKGDIIKKSNNGTYSVLRGQSVLLHIDKNANYTFMVTDLPEDQVVVVENTHATATITLTVPATYVYDIQNDRINLARTTYTLNAGESVAIRNRQGNTIEIIGDPRLISAAGVGFQDATVSLGASATLTVLQKSAKLTANNIAATLPATAGLVAGDIYLIKVGNFTGCTIVPSGTVDGSAAAIMLAPYESVTLRWDTTEWERI